MFDSASVYDNTPLLSRQFITTTYRSRLRFCTPRTFFRSVRGCIAEFLAMTILMFISTMVVRFAVLNKGSADTLHITSDQPAGSVLMIGIGNGFLYAVLVAITMHISGGFLNPAVTIGVVLAGALNPVTAICYILMQIIGAVTGAAIASLYSESAVNSAVQHINRLPHNEDFDAGTIMLAVFYEFITASLLVMVVLNVAIDKASKLKNVSPIVLGFSVAVGNLATADFTGGSLNPARSFGPAVIGTADNRWDYHYVHWIGPITGAIITSVVYRLFFASKAWIPVFRRREDDEEDDDVISPIN